MPLDPKATSSSPSHSAPDAHECGEPPHDAQTDAIARVVLAASLVERDPDRIQLEDLCETLHTLPGLDEFDLCRAASCIESLHEGGSIEFATLQRWIDAAAVAIEDPSLRRSAYQLAVYACQWDGLITAREESVLEAIAEAFDFTREEARVLAESVSIAMSENTWPSRTSRDRLSAV